MTHLEATLFILAALGAISVLILLIVLVAALRWWWQDMRHLRERARSLADAPVLDEAVREAVRLRSVGAEVIEFPGRHGSAA